MVLSQPRLICREKAEYVQCISNVPYLFFTVIALQSSETKSK